MRYFKIQYVASKYHEIQWNDQWKMSKNNDMQGDQWATMRYNELQWDTIRDNEIQWDTMSCNKIQWDTMCYNEIHWDTMRYI